MTKRNIPYEVELLEHNGVSGSNPVAPFAGRIISVPVHGIEQELIFEGRFFSHAYSVEFDTNGFHCFREKVQSKPSAWALAKAS